MLSFAYIQPQLHLFFSGVWWWCCEWVQSSLYPSWRMLPDAGSCLRCFHHGVWCNVRKGRAGLDFQGVLWFEATDPPRVLLPAALKDWQSQFFLPSLCCCPSPCHPLVSCVWPNEIIPLVCSLSSSPDVPMFTLSDCLLLFGSGYHDAHLWGFAVVLEVHDTLALSL